MRGVPNLIEYGTLLESDTREYEPLLGDMLTSVTSFFRDREAFESLEREIIPELFKDKNVGEEVRVWVAARATGEEAYLVLGKHRQGASTIGHVGCRHGDCMWQPLRVDGDMTLDARYFVPGVIAFVLRGVGILDALRVHDAKGRRVRPPIAPAFLLHLIFLIPAQAGWVHLGRLNSSIDRSSSARC